MQEEKRGKDSLTLQAYLSRSKNNQPAERTRQANCSSELFTVLAAAAASAAASAAAFAAAAAIAASANEYVFGGVGAQMLRNRYTVMLVDDFSRVNDRLLLWMVDVIYDIICRGYNWACLRAKWAWALSRAG